jgi:hypothetical protein
VSRTNRFSQVRDTSKFIELAFGGGYIM